MPSATRWVCVRRRETGEESVEGRISVGVSGENATLRVKGLPALTRLAEESEISRPFKTGIAVERVVIKVIPSTHDSGVVFLS